MITTKIIKKYGGSFVLILSPDDMESGKFKEDESVQVEITKLNKK